MASQSQGAGETPRQAWIGLDQAASFLGIPVVTLRRSLERNARKGADGTTRASIDGISARKLGRLWRIWLDAAWLNPAPQK